MIHIHPACGTPYIDLDYFISQLDDVFEGLNVIVLDLNVEVGRIDEESEAVLASIYAEAASGHQPSDDELRDAVWLNFGARPLDRRTRPRAFNWEDDLGSQWMWNESAQPLDMGWLPVEVTSTVGLIKQAAVYQPSSRAWYTVAPIDLLDGCNEQVYKMLFTQFKNSCLNAELREHLAAEMQQRRREEFYTFVERGAESAISTIESEIADLVNQRAGYMEQYNRLESLLVERRTLLDMRLNQVNTLDREAADRELSAIERHDKVVSIDISPDGQKLHVYTKNIYLPHPYGELPDAVLGEYKVTLDLTNNSMNAINLTNRKGTYDHPHIHNQSFCAGTWSATIQQLMKDRQYAAAVNFMLDTLEHCNPDDDWGRSFRHWFTDDNNDTALANAVHGE